MKKVIFILLCIVAIGCISTKKATKTTEQLSSERIESKYTSVYQFADTSKIESNKITITEIEFFPPSVQRDKDTRDKDTIQQSSVNIVGLNIGIKDAAIKSIKQTTIEAKSEHKAVVEESSKESEEKKEIIEQFAETKSTPVSVSHRWRYIFYILVLISIGLMYLKRVPVLNWIKKILSGIRLFF